MQDQFQIVGRYQTEHALRYMGQLCKHFGHKVEARLEGDEGFVDFTSGTARFKATEGQLTVTLSAADQDAAERLKPVIDSHLERFAFREDFKNMDWEGA